MFPVALGLCAVVVECASVRFEFTRVVVNHTPRRFRTVPVERRGAECCFGGVRRFQFRRENRPTAVGDIIPHTGMVDRDGPPAVDATADIRRLVAVDFTKLGGDVPPIEDGGPIGSLRVLQRHPPERHVGPHRDRQQPGLMLAVQSHIRPPVAVYVALDAQVFTDGDLTVQADDLVIKPRGKRDAIAGCSGSNSGP